MIADRLRTLSWSNFFHPTGVVKLVYGIPSFQVTSKAVYSKGYTFKYWLYCSHITQTDGRRAKFKKNRATSVDCRPTSTPILADFVPRTTFFVEAPKLKVSLTDPPIFIGFVIGEASVDDRPMIGRQFEEIYIMISAKGRQTIGVSIGRRSPDGRSITFYQRIVGRRTPDISRHSADGRPTDGRS